MDVQLRAERAEAEAVLLRVQLHARAVEAHTVGLDVRFADELTEACEAALKQHQQSQREMLIELTRERNAGVEQREALTQGSRQVEELQLVVAHLEAQLEAERAAASTAKAKYVEQVR